MTVSDLARSYLAKARARLEALAVLRDLIEHTNLFASDVRPDFRGRPPSRSDCAETER